MWTELLNAFEMHTTLFLILLGLLGLAIGSFLNVVIYRLPIMWANEEKGIKKQFNLAYPSSHCPYCKTPLKIWHNIPILSYLCLRGKCATCHAPISLRYLIVEILSSSVAVIAGIEFGFSLTCLAASLFSWWLIVISFIDMETQWVPDSLTLPLLWIGLIVSCFELFANSSDAILGAVIAYVFLWVTAYLFYRIRKKEGIGFGDFKLLAAAGAWLGWQLLPFIVLFSSLLGLLVGGSILLSKRLSPNTPIPFAPFIAIAAWIAMIWGFDITHYYLHFAGIEWTNV